MLQAIHMCSALCKDVCLTVLRSLVTSHALTKSNIFQSWFCALSTLLQNVCSSETGTVKESTSVCFFTEAKMKNATSIRQKVVYTHIQD